MNVEMHPGSPLSPCLFAMVMDRMTDEIRQEAPERETRETLLFIVDVYKQ